MPPADGMSRSEEGDEEVEEGDEEVEEGDDEGEEGDEERKCEMGSALFNSGTQELTSDPRFPPFSSLSRNPEIPSVLDTSQNHTLFKAHSRFDYSLDPTRWSFPGR